MTASQRRQSSPARRQRSWTMSCVTSTPPRSRTPSPRCTRSSRAPTKLSTRSTPIEREDISTLANALDVVTDRIEGVLHRIYFTNIQEMRPDALMMSAKVMRACEQMHDLVLELPQFKRSKSLREHVITVNTIESECDDLFINAMRTLHTTDLDPLAVISWRDVYMFLEFAADSCEFVADTVESIVMKNS